LACCSFIGEVNLLAELNATPSREAERGKGKPMRGPIVRRIAFLLAAATVLAFPTDGALADPGTCHSIEYEHAAYIICEVDLRRHTVRLYWNRPDGTPYAYLSDLPRDLENGGGRLLFATNAGMFDSKLKPVGLYVEHGQELVRASTKPERAIST
jgi:uncharacterized protein YigE (DUF2233 family)